MNNINRIKSNTPYPKPKNIMLKQTSINTNIWFKVSSNIKMKHIRENELK